MSKKLKLTKIELETKDGKTMALTLDEAKELHDQLHDLFGMKYVPSTPNGALLCPAYVVRGFGEHNAMLRRANAVSIDWS